jgi:hypothetical protein
MSLILKHCDISISTEANTASSECGYWSNGKQSTTWRVNLARMLGDEMFRNHTHYKLTLNQLSKSSASFGGAQADSQIMFVMSGMPVYQGTYDVATNTHNRKYHFLTQDLAYIGETFTFTTNVSSCIIQPTAENIEIKIDLLRAMDGLPCNNTGANKFPHCVYNFSITPI